MKTKFLGFRFILGDVISGVGFWSFWLRLLGPGLNRFLEVFCWSYRLVVRWSSISGSSV